VRTGRLDGGSAVARNGSTGNRDGAVAVRRAGPGVSVPGLDHARPEIGRIGIETEDQLTCPRLNEGGKPV
jgi:hypothetical protein